MQSAYPRPRVVYRNALRVVPDHVTALQKPCQMAFSVSGIDTLHIHVPDVAAYIPEGSTLEQSAAARRRSIYTPETALTMLPPHVEAMLCFPHNAQQHTVTYTCRITEEGNLMDCSVKLSFVESVKVMSYSQMEKSRNVRAWEVGRRLAALSVIRRASHGGNVIPFHDLSSIVVQTQQVHWLTHDMIFADPDLVTHSFADCPVRVAMDRDYFSAAHFIVRELEIIAGEINQSVLLDAHAWDRPRQCDSDFSLFAASESSDVIVALLKGKTNANHDDVFTSICSALRSPEEHVPLLRVLYRQKDLGTKILPCTSPLSSYSELMQQYKLHKADLTVAVSRYSVVDECEKRILGRRAGFIQRWIDQQPAQPTNATKRMRCVVLQRSYDHAVLLAPLLGHIFEVHGPFLSADTVMIPLQWMVGKAILQDPEPSAA